MRDTQTCKVVFQPSGRTGMVAPGTSVLDAARLLGVGITSICGGQALCGKCVVLVEEGTFPKHDLISGALHLVPPEEDEADYLLRQDMLTAARLACRARILGDVIITVPPESQSQQQAVHKTLDQKALVVDSPIHLASLTLSQPQLPDGSEQERALAVLRAQRGIEGIFEHAALRDLPEALREGGGAFTATLWNATSIIRVQPGHEARAWGLAVDIGSTTLAVYLCDLETGTLIATAAATNPQVTYGDDIMSRITYAVEQPQGQQRLHESVITVINSLAKEVTECSGGNPEDVLDVTLVGNSVMHHLALDLDPTSLGRLPFLPVLRAPIDLRATDLGLHLHRGARVHVLPLIAGFVGADTVGVLLAQAPHLQDEVTLIIDVGTNGEIVLGNRQQLLCTSAATGPALEGAQILHGMRAAPGAIERVRIDPVTLETRFRVIGQAAWSDALPPEMVQARGICGSGIIEAVAELFVTGAILPSGRFDRRRGNPRLVQVDGKPAFVLAEGPQSITGRPIVITQRDVRAVQLAKAALYVGARYLMRELGVESVSRIVLAGAFGTLMDKERAMRIGMIPDCDLRRVVSVGNAAGEGACMALLSCTQRQEAARLARWVRHILISQEADFQDAFAAALAFPHASDPFPHVMDQARTHVY